MRPIFGFVLLLGACGDNMTDDVDGLDGFGETADTDGVAAEDGNSSTTPRLRPLLCGTREFGMEVASRDLDLSVASTPNGAAIFTVPRAGGAIQALTIDGRGLVTGEESGTIVRDDLKFYSVAASYVDERLILASTSTDGISFDMVRDDLAQRIDLGSIKGDLVSPFASARGGTRVGMVAGKDGVSSVTFDKDWKLVGSELVSAVEPFALASAPYFDDMIVAWSSADSCHVRRVGAQEESVGNFPCLGAELAVDSANYRGVLVYEQDGNVMISDIRVGGEQLLANHRLLASNATTPRVTYDGKRFWVSYVDLRADLVVGFMNGSDHVSMSLEGLTPDNGNHELAVVNQRPWIFDLGAQGIAARGLCVVADQ